MIKLCVFDCDGTLVDSQHTIVACMHAAFDEHEMPRPTSESIRRIVGLPLEEGIARLSPQATVDVLSGIREGYRRAFMTRRQAGEVEEPLFPGVIETLHALEDAGWLLGVATGKGYPGLMNTLSPYGLENRFVTVQTADKALGKPNPDMLFRAMAETGAAAANTVMVGDTTFDILMARSAGTGAIGVSWGYHEVEELDAAGAHAVVHAYDALPEALSRLIEPA